MKGIQRISDLRTILQKSRVSKDSRITTSFLLSRMNAYRSKEIHDSFERNHEVYPECFQDMGACRMTPVSSSDDPTVPKAGITVGRYNAPAIISMTNKRGIIRISTESKLQSYYPIEYERFFELVQESLRAKFPYYFQIGTTIYSYPYKEWMSMVLMLEDPMEGYVINTSYFESGQLIFATDYIQAEQYEVIEGGVNHNGVQYNQGNVFTAVNANFTGAGKVKLVNRKRKLTLEDEYPMSSTMFETIMMKILTKDFKLEEKEIADVRNNAADELYIRQEKSD